MRTERPREKKEWEARNSERKSEVGVRKCMREKKQNGHKYKTARAQGERREETEE